MKIKLEMFNTEEDLRELTGLTHDGLLEAGFDLDDWDFGVVTDRKLASYYDDSYGDEIDYILTQMMGDWCCGYYAYEFNNKFYHLVYHS